MDQGIAKRGLHRSLKRHVALSMQLCVRHIRTAESKHLAVNCRPARLCCAGVDRAVSETRSASVVASKRTAQPFIVSFIGDSVSKVADAR